MGAGRQQPVLHTRQPLARRPCPLVAGAYETRTTSRPARVGAFQQGGAGHTPGTAAQGPGGPRRRPASGSSPPGSAPPGGRAGKPFGLLWWRQNRGQRMARTPHVYRARPPSPLGSPAGRANRLDCAGGDIRGPSSGHLRFLRAGRIHGGRRLGTRYLKLPASWSRHVRPESWQEQDHLHTAERKTQPNGHRNDSQSHARPRRPRRAVREVPLRPDGGTPAPRAGIGRQVRGLGRPPGQHPH